MRVSMSPKLFGHPADRAVWRLADDIRELWRQFHQDFDDAMQPAQNHFSPNDPRLENALALYVLIVGGVFIAAGLVKFWFVP